MEHPPAAVAWADQFRAEFRDRARAIYSGALAEHGVTIVVDDEGLQTLDTLFEIGGTAVIEVLGAHGCLKQADR